MTWTTEQALNHPSVVRSEETASGYSFWLAGISTEITVTLTPNLNRGGYDFHLSHLIKTPVQLDRYCPSRPWGDSKGYALRQAVMAIADYHRSALESGHTPQENWLFPN